MNAPNVPSLPPQAAPKKKDRFSFYLYLSTILAIRFSLVVLGVYLEMCAALPLGMASDSYMIRHFTEVRSDLEELRNMLEQDKRLNCVAGTSRISKI